ncbi:molybdate ABC transporter permease subunit [Desulfobaculum bizertense]|uniref:Molybdenum transport system permease n=1 Tax=Desulfobaculum bizertense DSM 18034 TaxID=1121442 RepID=A0A1T4VQP2_9BACT|nr:molybdate ABC transporter permease subunit [Desulfobaculum bizertense]UIJ38207.1 molybdate ABC transporter permease subunit [Desulfobaculum bizertense]SKA66801.1 molybdate transport system permease protein [Desulfobaculum bizertense DSM 18034]
MDLTPLLLSAKLALATTCFIPFVAAPLAYILAFAHFRGKSLLDAIVSLPMVLPPTVLGFALLLVLGPQGPLGALWEQTTGQRLVFSFGGILIASLVYNLPFAIQPMRAAFEKLDIRLLESASVLGLSPCATFVRVVLPNSLPGLSAAAMLVFAHSLGEFGVILMVGGSIPGTTKVASVAIYEAVEALRYADAFKLCMAMVPISFAALLAINHLNTRTSS